MRPGPDLLCNVTASIFQTLPIGTLRVPNKVPWEKSSIVHDTERVTTLLN